MHAKNALSTFVFLMSKGVFIRQGADFPPNPHNQRSFSFHFMPLSTLISISLYFPSSFIFPCDPVPFFFTSSSNTLDFLPLDFGLKDLPFT